MAQCTKSVNFSIAYTFLGLSFLICHGEMTQAQGDCVEYIGQHVSPSKVVTLLITTRIYSVLNTKCYSKSFNISS